MTAFSNQDSKPIRLGLLGQSLSHSLSPVIHQAFMEELGLEGRYDKIEVPDAADVPERLKELAREGYSGLNVTIPYKLTVFPCMEILDEHAELAGAVNTIKLGSRFSGYNTDVSGLAEALSPIDFGSLAGENVNAAPPLKALILGSGGAARAAVIAVSLLGFKQIAVVCRDGTKARTLLDQVMQGSERASLVQNCRDALVADLDKPVENGVTSGVALVINATPVGQKTGNVPPPVVQVLESVQTAYKSAVFVDLVYSKAETPMCRTARELGFAHVEDGREMLLHQARYAFKIWTGNLPAGDLARERLK